jgi:ubiquinone/menaquinone biosynthesis C-methylase UbiE
LSPEDLRDLYADQADLMDRLSVLDRLVFGRARRRLFGRAEGDVLDVACGTGLNRTYLPPDVEYVGIDLSPAMLSKAAASNEGLERRVDLLEMDAQTLAFTDDSFDTIVSSLSTCTFPDPQAALAEMGRVCRPEGQILLLEHGRSSVGLIARFQDWRAEAHYEKHGCRWTQEPLEVLAASDLTVERHRSGPLGIVTAIRATSG